MLVVTTASAWLRLAQPRPPCTDWPGCRSQSGVQALAATAPAAGLGMARVAHRTAASSVLLVVAALVLLALARRPRDAATGALALVLLALALGLALLGIFTPGARHAGVRLGNLLGGLLMLALSWRLLRGLQGAPAISPPVAIAALAGMLAWLAQAALGANAGAGSGIAAIGHLGLALLALPLAFGVGLAATRQGRRAEGRALMLLAPLQALLGMAGVALAAAPASVLLHNLLAASGIALMCGLTVPRKP
jgi:cytochrome c oxidase assembly protein subunit 15